MDPSKAHSELNVASKLYGVNAALVIFVFVLYCIIDGGVVGMMAR